MPRKSKNRAFPTLEREIVARGILKENICKKLGISTRTFSRVLNGTRDFVLDDAIFIWETWFSDTDFCELFNCK